MYFSGRYESSAGSAETEFYVGACDSTSSTSSCANYPSDQNWRDGIHVKLKYNQWDYWPIISGSKQGKQNYNIIIILNIFS